MLAVYNLGSLNAPQTLRRAKPLVERLRGCEGIRNQRCDDLGLCGLSCCSRIANKGWDCLLRVTKSTLSTSSSWPNGLPPISRLLPPGSMHCGNACGEQLLSMTA